jgi:maltose alpha-D-glucosyltransferase/alpha-amylase
MSRSPHDDTPWHQDAIFYEVSVKSFFDANGDGIGDFAGLTEKLDYLQELGATALWLMPFYPSPWRDDGYDIADFRGVHPSLGSMADFRRFIAEAERRNLRVVADLVINHTSSEHPWYQAARQAAAGSSLRNFYLWNDGSRLAYEKNGHPNQTHWTWDDAASAYVWHRFASHQPDLNYDHPPVLEEMGKVLRFWLDQGASGLSLSGAAFLVERLERGGEGLPETHHVLRQLRAATHDYSDAFLAAGVNAWPDAAASYLSPDECQLAPQLPLAQRLFLALRQENRFPVMELLRSTPTLPPGGQWLTLLRNHDELALQLATDEERDYMYRQYAADSRMREQRGILRRLAPLLDNSRARLELMFGLLLSLPGAPLIYYGDEIGMGDNVFLGGRAAVRTPMQWSADRNGGFSRAETARLFAPPIVDPNFGFAAVNTEAQRRDPSSLYHHVRQLISIRKRIPAFARGDLQLLEPNNDRILAFVRRQGDEAVLVVANLARSLQYVALEASDFAGRTPVDLLGRSQLPKLAGGPLQLTLGPHAIYWLALEKKPERVVLQLAPEATRQVEAPPELRVQRTEAGGLSSELVTKLEQEILPRYFPQQRWFGAKARKVRQAKLIASQLLTQEPATYLALWRVEFDDGRQDTYCFPFGVDWSQTFSDLPENLRRFAVARLLGSDREGLLYDALASDEACLALLDAVPQGRTQPAGAGELRAVPTPVFATLRGNGQQALPVVRAGATSSNSLVLFGRRLLMKLFRRLEPGVNPDVEIGRYFTEKQAFRPTPQLAGTLEYHSAEQPPLTLAIVQSLVPNQGDGWEHVLHELSRYYERASGRMRGPDPPPRESRSVLELASVDPQPTALEVIGSYLYAAATLGHRTAEMHLALAASQSNEAFDPKPLDTADFRALADDIMHQGERALQAMESNLDRLGGETAAEADQFLKLAPERLDAFRRETPEVAAADKIRCHGDYHLGQVLRVENDYVILDFEGEPTRSVEDRRAKQSPLKDVAGMLRSYDYAAYAGLFAYAESHPDDFEALEPWARCWQQWVSAAFLKAYFATADGASFLPRDRAELSRVLDLCLLAKVLYELVYELNNRPDWVRIPLRGVLDLLGHRSPHETPSTAGANA